MKWECIWLNISFLVKSGNLEYFLSFIFDLDKLRGGHTYKQTNERTWMAVYTNERTNFEGGRTYERTNEQKSGTPWHTYGKCSALYSRQFFLGGGPKSPKIIFYQFSRHFRQFWTTLMFFIFDNKILYAPQINFFGGAGG